jgi:hypothetical protein
MLRFLAVSMLMAAPAAATPCTPAGLAGIWTFVSIRADEPGVEQFYRQAPYEVMRFGANGGFMYVASNRPYGAADAADRLNAADARDGTSYSYRIDGPSLLLFREGAPFQAFTCRIADRLEGDARPGDLILTNQPGRPMLRRVERRLR